MPNKSPVGFSVFRSVRRFERLKEKRIIHCLTTHAKSCGHWNALVEVDSSTAFQPWASLWPGTMCHPSRSKVRWARRSYPVLYCPLSSVGCISNVNKRTHRRNQFKSGGDELTVSPKHQAWWSGEEHYSLIVSQGKLKRCVLKWGLDK